MNKKKILIAEDDVDISEALKTLLQDIGYHIFVATDELQIQEIMAKNDLPDLLLLDIWLSGEDGTLICRNLKNQTHTQGIPIIICSGNTDTERLARECGANDFIEKPFDMGDLLQKIKKHLG